MPCSKIDTICPDSGTTNAGRPNINPDPTAAYANMGWVGFVRIDSDKLSTHTFLRVTSCDIKLSQEITKPDVIDGRIDPTVYQLGPKIIEGTLSMPIIADTDTPGSWTNGSCPNVTDLRSLATGTLNSLWCWATARDAMGRLSYDDVSLDVRYANHAGFKYDQCVANTYSMKVTQGDMVSLDLGVYGRGRTQSATTGSSFIYAQYPEMADFLSPARVLTWNDVTINGIGGCGMNGEALFYSNQIRDFSMEIANNADRFYTLCGSLFPIDINVGKREITGSMTLMGLKDKLRVLAETNQDRFTEKNEIRIVYYIGSDTFTPSSGGFTSRDWTENTDAPNSNDAIWYKKLTAVVFNIEEMSLTNEVFETTVNWHAMASDQACYQAFVPSSSPNFPAWE